MSLAATLKHASLIFPVVFSAIGLVSCQSFEPSIPRPDWRVGDTWVYHVKFILTDSDQTEVHRQSRQTIRAIHDGEIELVAEETGGEKPVTTVVRWNAEGDTISQARAGKPMVQYQPPLSFNTWPSRPGQEWVRSVEYRYEHESTSRSTVLSARVIGWERVSAPAGEFQALKSEITIADRDGRRKSVATLWFTPQAKRHVKYVERIYFKGRHEATRVQELLAFEVSKRGSEHR